MMHPARAAVEVVCGHFNVPIFDVMSKASRKRHIAHARQLAMSICRDISDMSVKDIGKTMGHFDHGTVSYSISQVRSRCNETPWLGRVYPALCDEAEALMEGKK